MVHVNEQDYHEVLYETVESRGASCCVSPSDVGKPSIELKLLHRRDLHLGSASSLSEVTLATNLDLFGPSARLAFTEASISHFHHSTLDAAHQIQSEDGVLSGIHRLKANNFRPDLHKLLVVQPSLRRDIPEVTTGTRYACKVLESAGRQTVQTLVDRLGAPAEFVLESIIRKHFTRGGKFPLTGVTPLYEDKGKDRLPVVWRITVPTPTFFHDNTHAWMRVGCHAEPAIHISRDKALAITSAMASPVEPLTPFTPYTLVPMSRQASYMPVTGAPPTPISPHYITKEAYYRWMAPEHEIPPPAPVEVPPTPVSIHFSQQDLERVVRNPLKTGFIPPRTGYAPPYDFIAFCEEENSAIVFQSFYAHNENRFAISTHGIRWLRSKDVERISYVAVLLGPHPGSHLEFFAPIEPRQLVGVDIFVSLHDRYGHAW